jgi:LuxR family maltose regulon positive regulatory protein
VTLLPIEAIPTGSVTYDTVGLADSPSPPTKEAGPTTWFGPTFLLEWSKLDAPSPRPGTVPRRGLLERLRAASVVPVVSIAAPAGYGKSALLRQWADETLRRVAWLSLEREDNDPAVLLAYIAAALDRLEPIDAEVFRTRTPPGTSVAATVARRVAATLASMDDPVALVLDNAEIIHNPQCRDAIAELALHLPATAQLVVASRGTPPIPLASLRSRGAVVELGADDLAMDEAEARALLNGAGVELSTAELAELLGQTEGWPVGLYFGALARRVGHHGTAGVAFSGDDRLMADYLRTELLAHVPRGRVSFLTRTSILDRMCGPLCDAVLGRTRSGRLLEALEGSNLLLVPLDRRREWYRYHRLFRQLLRAELGQREGEIVAKLHTRAARWCEAHDLPEMAIDHAQAAGDADQVARLVGTHMQAAYADGRLETVCRWLQWFDDRELIERYPAVAILGAVIQALMGQGAAAERWVAGAEAAPSGMTAPDGSKIGAWQALLAAFLCRKGIPRMRGDTQTAYEGLAAASRLRPAAQALQGISWLLEGDLDRADLVLAHAVELGLDIGARPATAVALAERAIVAIHAGGWDSAEALAERGVAIVREARLDDYAPSALVYAVAARTAVHTGDMARSRESLADANRLRPQLSYTLPFFSVQTLLELARTYLALTDTAGARVVLREARDILRLRPDLGSLPQAADELQSTLDTLRVGAVGASSLTMAELRLVPLLSTHLSFREIGERLYISRHTVKTQAISIYRKLGVSSRSEAIERVEAMGLLSA